MPAVKPCRAFELDALRGLALFLMVLHHFAFDMRYVMGLDIFAFQETWWFAHLLQPFFLNVFIVVSGICCTFSRNNTKRGLRLLLAALALSLLSIVLSDLTGGSFAIYFNVLHLLALGILLVAWLTAAESRAGKPLIRTDVILLLAASALIYGGSLLTHWSGSGSWWLLPIGLPPKSAPAMADYLPLLPWLGFFLTGVLIGRRAYSGRCSAVAGAPTWIKEGTRPLAWLGRHSLLVYALHQPIILAALMGLRALGWL